MLTAIIDQNICVKCALCIEACPFDSIIGSVGQKHEVLMESCVGCKLCVNSCPVDCINMVPLVKQIVINAKKRRAAKIAKIKLQEVAKFVDPETIRKDLKEILVD